MAVIRDSDVLTQLCLVCSEIPIITDQKMVSSVADLESTVTMRTHQELTLPMLAASFVVLTSVLGCLMSPVSVVTTPVFTALQTASIIHVRPSSVYVIF